MENRSLVDAQTELELSWLLYKSRIQQEFVSIHHLLHEREEELVSKMKKRVDIAVEALHILDKHTWNGHTLIPTKNTTKDSNEQSEDYRYQLLLWRLEAMCNESREPLGRDDWMPKFLNMPFSLLKEKLHLNNTLQFESYECPRISPKRHTLFLCDNDLTSGLKCSDLWNEPNRKPASTTCLYTVTITDMSGKFHYLNKFNVDYADAIFTGFLLPRNKAYLVKVVPVYTCYGCAGGMNSMEGQPTTILIVLEKSFNTRRSPPEFQKEEQNEPQGFTRDSRRVTRRTVTRR